MLFNNNRNQMRDFFFETWRKHLQKKPLELLEQQLVDIILIHPEYHTLLADVDGNRERTYTTEQNTSNPFLHLALHLGLLEQLNSNRPIGIHKIYRQLVEKTGGPHQAQHVMIDCIAENMWQAQKNGVVINDAAYLRQLSSLI